MQGVPEKRVCGGTEQVLVKPSATLGKTSNSKTDSLALHYCFAVET